MRPEKSETKTYRSQEILMRIWTPSNSSQNTAGKDADRRANS
jgi:hypothetical protein